MFDKGSETVPVALRQYLCKLLKTEALGNIHFTWHLTATNNGTLSSQYPIFLRLIIKSLTKYENIFINQLQIIATCMINRFNVDRILA
jgi:hypothetical protein